MTASYTSEVRPDYIYIHIKGSYDFDQFKEFVFLIGEECRKNEKFKVIVDCTEVRQPNVSKIDRLLLGLKVVEMFGFKSTFIVVWPGKYITKLLEKVANHMGTDVFVVPDLDKARTILAGTN